MVQCAPGENTWARAWVLQLQLQEEGKVKFKKTQKTQPKLIYLFKKVPLLGFVWLFHKSSILWLKQILFELEYFQIKKLSDSNGKMSTNEKICS